MRRFKLILLVSLALAGFVILLGEVQISANDTQQAKVVSVREVRHASLRMSRYPTTPQYMMDLALEIDGQTYCTAYETPVLDEVQDLQAANGHDLQVTMQGKKVTMVLPSGRHVQADLVKSTQC
jgi:hypothetical protein